MKKPVVMLLSIAILFVMMNNCLADGTSSWVEVTAGSSPFVYSDELLMVDENRLDPDIAKMSAALAAAAYSKDAVRNMLSQMGFATIDSYYDATYSLTDNDHVAYTIAKKVVGDYTIYCVPVRGTAADNKCDWISNLNFSQDGQYHAGFKAAADEVWDDLLAMISADGSSREKRIIWVTGHSRGAAVANILAGRLTYYEAGHVFGYTFACPAVYVGSASTYTNIYNFNFDNDLVPQMPPTSWGFTRYGIDVTKDISSWSESIMSKTEVDTIISALNSSSGETKVTLGLISWVLTDRSWDALRTIWHNMGYDNAEGLIYLISNYLITNDVELRDTSVEQFRTECKQMLTFWDSNRQAMYELSNEEFMLYRAREENCEVFALYDNTAGSTVSSFDQLQSIIPTIKERSSAATDLLTVVDIIPLLFDTNWQPKNVIKAHDSGYYTQWMNQNYFGYRGCAGQEYNTEILITARTISPQCFDGASGSFTINSDKVDAIASEAFVNCHGLSTVVIDGSQSYIGYGAFSNCSGLKKITLPADYDRYNHFFVGSAVETIVYTSGNTGIIANRVKTSTNSSTTMQMPEYDVRESLKKIVFEEGITHIGDYLCYGGGAAYETSCIQLESIVLPTTLKSIGKFSFYGCKSLSGFTLPEGLNGLGEGCFEECTSIKKIHIPSTLETIPKGAFRECYSLLEINIPVTLKIIEEEAFYNCIGLTELKIPRTMTQIGLYAFGGCTGLVKLVLPADFFSYNNSFVHCGAVETIVYTSGNTGIIANRVKTSTNSSTTMQMPEYDVRESLKKIVFEEGVTHIGDYLCYGGGAAYETSCVQLESIVFPTTLKSIGQCSFYGCNSIKELVIPENVSIIGDSSFIDCSRLDNITFKHAVDNSLVIGSGAFRVSNWLDTLLHVPDALNVNQAITGYDWTGSNRNVFYMDSSYILGDADKNGAVDVFDALIVLQYSAGWSVTLDFDNADVNGDGIIGLSDALQILSHCFGGDLVSALRALNDMLDGLNISALKIVEQPGDQHIAVGQKAQFTVMATGENLKYQWYINRNDGNGWCELKGAVGSMYVTSAVEVDCDGFQYRCVIADVYGNEHTSDVAVLHVMLELPVTGDASTPALWLVLCMLSVLGMVIINKQRALR